MRPSTFFAWASRIAQTNVWRRDYSFFWPITGEVFWKLVWKQSTLLQFCLAQTLLYLKTLNKMLKQKSYHFCLQKIRRRDLQTKLQSAFSLSSVFSRSFVFRQAGYFELRIQWSMGGGTASPRTWLPRIWGGFMGVYLTSSKSFLSFHAHLSKWMLLNMNVWPQGLILSTAGRPW